MCFLYRQSISIVYESKFKYIYRYFIKIDRCFCEILQSLPLRKCGLKSRHMAPNVSDSGCHFPCGSVDWNISDPVTRFVISSVTSLAEVWIEMSGVSPLQKPAVVTSLAEVWIEIWIILISMHLKFVTSLAEVWIEILFYSYLGYRVVSLPLRKCGLKSVWQIL